MQRAIEAAFGDMRAFNESVRPLMAKLSTQMEGQSQRPATAASAGLELAAVAVASNQNPRAISPIAV